MKLKTFVFVAAIVAGSSSPAWAGEKVLFQPPPSWVVARPPAPQTPSDKDLPVVLLSLDTQMRADGDAQTVYTASEFKFLTSQGLSSGNITLNWQPETQDLIVHRVLIHRGDQTIDVLGEGQTFTILRREQNLEQATLDGTLTANLFPAGLEVGDILEVAMTIVSRNPVLGDHADNLFGPYNISADRVDVSLSWPADREVQLDRTDDLPQWKRSKSDGFEHADLSMTDLRPLVPPRAAPTRYSILRLAQVSDFGSWGEVSRLFAPLYAKAAKIPVDGPLRDEVEKIRTASDDPAVRAEQALQLVQGKIRYVALLSGLGSLVPADATETWARRYGDCKGKTALLIGILSELGIEAQPVLVNTGIGEMLQERLPSASLFDHVLVRATIAGKTYWLDGTRSGDMSLDRLQTPNLGWGLPVGQDQDALVRMLPAPPDQPTEDLSIELDARKGLYDDVPANVEMLLRGDSAIVTNQALSQIDGELREQALRNYWRGKLDFITADKLDWHYDESSGELRLTMSGKAKMDWDGGWYATDWTSVGYRADFDRQPGPSQDAPFANEYPDFERTRETILLPPGFTANAIRGGADVDETVAGIAYTRHTSMENGRFVVERTERSLVPEIAAEDARKAKDRLRELYDRRVQLRVPDNYFPTKSDIKQAAATDSTDAADLVTLGNNLLTANKNEEALELLTRATDADPKNEWAWGDRALAEANLGKFAQASVTLDQGIASVGKETAFLARVGGILAERQNDSKTAIAKYDKAIELNPKDSFSLLHRAIARMSNADPEGALADADASLALDPAQLYAYGLKAYVLMGQGKRDEANEAIEALLENNSDNLAAAAMARQLYQQIGEPEKASALASGSPQAPKTPGDWLNHAALRDPSDREGQIADYTAALKLDPNFVRALSARGNVYYREGDYNRALKDIDSAIAEEPKDANLYLQKANILRAQGRRDDAIDVASTLSAQLPDNSFAQVAAGQIYNEFGLRKDAIAATDRALRIKPEAYIYVNRARILGDDDVAGQLTELDKALVLDPKEPNALQMRADILSKQGDYDAAVATYDKLIELVPQNEGFWIGQRGIAHWQAGDRKDAESDFAVARAKLFEPALLNNLCYNKVKAKVALESALQDCDRALELNPGSAPALDSRAVVYLLMGRNQQALEDFDRALAKSPRLAPSLYGRAVVKARMGDLTGARMDLAQAEEIEPDIVKDLTKRGIDLPDSLKGR